MSAISFHVEINDKPNKLGLHEIRIRMTQNRKHKRFNVGFAIKSSEWNSKTEQVSKAHSLYTIINAAISSKKIELETEYLKSIPTKSVATMNQIYNSAKSKILGESYIEFYKDYVSKIPNAGTALAFNSVLSKFTKFINSEELHFEELTFELIKDFISHLKKIGNGQNTIHNNIKTLRSIYNHAIKERRFIPKFVSPFYGHNIQKKKVRRNKLDTFEISSFEKLTPKENTTKFHAHKFFLLCYYLMGVRVSSMVLMKWKNVDGDRMVYTLAKGQGEQNTFISSKAMEILNYYKAQYAKKPIPNDYIFPFMKGCEKLTGKELVKKISAINTNINNQLAELSVELSLEKKITTHVARHSFAYNARKKSGNDIYAVQKALKHSSIVTTEAYFDAEEQDDSDNLAKLMFGE